MFGNNPIRKPTSGDGQSLEVVSIFPTLQGEGPRAGQPAIFIRLGGCNLSCDFCDTEFEDFAANEVKKIISQVKSLHTNQKLIVITGGEPLRQPIALLCSALVREGFIVQVETNGTLFRELPPEVEIVCSPKTKDIRPDLHERVTAFKFVVSATNPEYSGVWLKTDKPVYVQPMDEYDEAKNRANLEHARDLALKHGYNLSLQLHKILGIE